MRLQEAGIKAKDIVVWDRDSSELEHVGFHISTGGNPKPVATSTGKLTREPPPATALIVAATKAAAAMTMTWSGLTPRVWD